MQGSGMQGSGMQAPTQGSAMQGAIQGSPGAGVSALINETLSAMGSSAVSPEPTSNGFPAPFGPTPLGQGGQSFGTPQGGVPAAPFGMDPNGQQGPGAQFPPIPRELLDPSGAPGMHYPVGGGDLQPSPAPQSPAVAPAAPTSGGSSKLMLAVVCVLVLVLAAAVTFLALKFRAQIGF
jgi:hypothetical protein